MASQKTRGKAKGLLDESSSDEASKPDGQLNRNPGNPTSVSQVGQFSQCQNSQLEKTPPSQIEEVLRLRNLEFRILGKILFKPPSQLKNYVISVIQIGPTSPPKIKIPISYIIFYRLFKA